MDASLIVATLGVVLGALSLGWQAATHVLTGGRARVVLRVGAIGPGGGMVTTKPSSLSPNWAEHLAAQGYRRPVVSIRVANIGRLPVTVARWGLESTKGVSLYPVADSIGPALPHRLDVGESESWAVDMAQVQAFVTAAREALGDGGDINGVAELADGRTVRSADVIG